MIVLGWREWLSLPDLGIARLRAKVDTGARSSALHVDAQWRFNSEGAPWVGIRLTPGRALSGVVETAAPVLDEREVADSGGNRRRRVFIRTRLFGMDANFGVTTTAAQRDGNDASAFVTIGSSF